MGCRLYDGDGGSSLMRLSINIKVAISVVISTFTLPCYVSVKC
mgnify:CR=1 FL=1